MSEIIEIGKSIASAVNGFSIPGIPRAEFVFREIVSANNPSDALFVSDGPVEFSSDSRFGASGAPSYSIVLLRVFPRTPGDRDRAKLYDDMESIAKRLISCEEPHILIESLNIEKDEGDSCVLRGVISVTSFLSWGE